MKPDFVILQWCKCHYIHIICKDLNLKLGKNHILRSLLKNALVAAFNLNNMEECERWFKHVFIVLLSPYKTSTFEHSFEILNQCVTEVTDDNASNEYPIYDNDKIDSLESIAFNSPFRKVFLSIYEDIKNTLSNITTGRCINQYRNDDICEFLINKYCSFIVLWTNVMGIHVDPSGEHISNAPIEFSYFLQKHIILPQKSVRPDVFVKIMRIDYLSSLKELRYYYKMFGSVDKEIENIIIVSKEELNEKDDNSRIIKEHSYICSTPNEKKQDSTLNISVEIIAKEHSYSQLSENTKTEPEE